MNRKRVNRWIWIGGVVLGLACAQEAPGAVTVFPMDLVGFESAAGGSRVVVDFDDIAPGTDITGSTINGLTFQGPGAPLLVVHADDTFTPPSFSGVRDASTNVLPATSGENVLSPGGTEMGPGPNNAVENDDLTVIFSQPVKAFGFDHLSQSADGISYTNVTVRDPSAQALFSGRIPISGFGAGGPAYADFWGIVSTDSNIASVVIDEGDSNNVYPDSNIGFDTFRVPEPAGAALLVLGIVPLMRTSRRRR